MRGHLLTPTDDRRPAAATPAFAAATPGLAPLCRRLTVAGDGASAGLPLIDAGAIGGALALFARRFHRPDARALASLWSMHYLGALMVPAAAALLSLDLVLPVALADVRLRLAEDGTPAEIRLRDRGRCAGPADRGRRFDALVRGHLAPFAALFAATTGLSARLLWSNAATTLAHAVEAVAGAARPDARREAEDLLDGSAGFPFLARPFREAADGSRERELCCGRRRLPGVAPCYTLCPERNVC